MRVTAYVDADGRPIPGQPPLITDMSLSLPRGSRCLLIGANGAGKTTLLKIIAGKHMVGRDQVLVLGSSPFHDTELTTSGQLSYVGGNWTRDIAFAGTSIPLTVREMEHKEEAEGAGRGRNTRREEGGATGRHAPGMHGPGLAVAVCLSDACCLCFPPFSPLL